jgi:hypothetical protein
VTLTAAAIGLPNPNLPTVLNVTSTSGNGMTPGECGPDPNNTGNTLCTLVAQLPIGSDTLQISTYSEPQSQTESAPAGALLSQQNATETIVQGVANSFPITLDANPNNVAFSATPTSANLTGTISGLTVHGNGTATATIALTDAAGEPIVGPGAPTLSVTSNSAPSVATASISGSTLTVTTATAAGASGTTMVTLTSSPASSGDGLTSGTVTIPVNVVNVGLYGYGDSITLGPTTTNTVTLTAPPKKGDLLFVMVHVYDSTPPASVTAPMGWSEVANCSVIANGTSTAAPANCDAGSPSTKSHSYLFMRTATAADLTAYSYTFNVVGDSFAEIVGATNVSSVDASAATLTGAVEPVSPWALTGQPITQANLNAEVFLVFSGASESAPLAVAITPVATFTQLGSPTYLPYPDAAGAAWSAFFTGSTFPGFTPTVTWSYGTSNTDPVFVTIFTQGLLP